MLAASLAIVAESLTIGLLALALGAVMFVRYQRRKPPVCKLDCTGKQLADHTVAQPEQARVRQDGKPF